MVELIVNGQALELDSNTKIKYTKQISDIFNIAKVNASYTNSFSVAKTPHNTNVLQGLGLVGSTSQIPYQKIPATLKENGLQLIENGWLEVKETAENYKINIIEGAIDFFKQIENLTLGDIDLSKLDHAKTPSNIVGSFSNDFYRYILADYGGERINQNDFFIEYLVPSARYKYVVEQIAKHFEWQFLGSFTIDNNYKNSWITYPKEIEEDPNDFQQVGYFRAQHQTFNYGEDFKLKNWNVSYIPFVNSVKYLTQQNGKITIKETNTYKIIIYAKGYAQYKNGQKKSFYVRQNFSPDNPLLAHQIMENKTYQGFLSNNKVIEFFFQASPYIGIWNDPFGKLDYIYLDDLQVTFYKNRSAEVSFSDEFKNIKITDFFNDFLRRFALTPIFDNQKKRVQFHYLSERINRQNAIDWSDKFVSRDKETYLYGSYAKRNYFLQKTTQEQPEHQGTIYIDNQNLTAEKTLFQSPFYEPGKQATQIVQHWCLVCPIWEKEIQTNNDQIKINYKSLDQRFYILQTKKGKTSNQPVRFYKKDNPQQAVGLRSSNSVDVAKYENTCFKDLVPIYYKDYQKILNNCKVHLLTINLSVADIVNLDFTKPIYIQQEASYYIINKVEYQNGELSKVEAVRLN